MTILFTTDHYFPTVNGIVTHISLVRKELEKRGHRVIIVTPKFGRKYKKEEDVYYLPAIPLGLRAKDLLTIPFDPRIEKKLSETPIDIIHNHLFITGFLGLRIAQKKNIPMIVTYHTFIRQYADWVIPWAKFITYPTANWLARNYFAKHEAVLAPSEKAMDELKQAHVTSPIVLLHNGIHLEPFDKADPNIFKDRFQIKRDQPLVAIVGTLEKGKNVDLAIEAIWYLQKQIPHVKLAIVGDGKERKRLESLIDMLHLSNNVIVTGFLHQDLIASATKAADTILFTSTTDNFPTVILEALAAGKPIVAVNDAAIKDLVIPRINGFVTNKNAKQISQALFHLLTQPQTRERFAMASSKLSKQYSIEAYCDALEKIYAQAISSK